MRNKICFFLNGVKQEVDAKQGSMMLADFLRREKGLTGTKIVCAEGDCGACTVLCRFERPGQRARAAEFIPVNSCILRVAQMDGSSLVTVEGIAPENSTLSHCGGHDQGAPHERVALSPVQKAMVSCHGSQCGFCTPGFVMSLTGLVEKKLSANENTWKAQEVKNALTGNLCRCTGYQPILESAQSISLEKCEKIAPRYATLKQRRELQKIIKTPVLLKGGEGDGSDDDRFFAPVTLRSALAYLKKNPHSVIQAGGTDLGVLHNKRKKKVKQILSLHLIAELYELKKISATRARVGSRVTLSELRDFAKKAVPELARYLDLFASPQIKNVATLAGNIGNASPVAETPPFLLVSQTVVLVAGPKGKRKIPLEEFFQGYRKTALKPGELIVHFEFDLPKKSDFLSLSKVSQRKDLDISAVNSAIFAGFSMNKGTQVVREFRIAYGGVAATPLRLVKTEKFLVGRPLTQENLEAAVRLVHSEMSPMSDLRGTASFRRVVVENLFMKFFRSLK